MRIHSYIHVRDKSKAMKIMSKDTLFVLQTPIHPHTQAAVS